MPYAPGTEYRGDQSLFAGIAGAGSAMGSGLAQMGARLRQKEEQDKQEAKEAKRTRAIAKMFKDDWGLGDSDVERLDADTLKGMMEGHFLKTSEAGRKLREERDTLALQVMKRTDEDRQVFNRAMAMQTGGAPQGLMQMADPMQIGMPGTGARAPMTSTESMMPPPAEDADAPFMVNMGGFGKEKSMGGAAAPPYQFGPMQLMQTAAASGMLTPEMALKMMDDGQSGIFGREDIGIPREMPGLPNNYFVPTSRSAGQVTFNPSSMMSGGGVQRVPVMDDAGQPTGDFMIPNGRGGLVRAPKSKQSVEAQEWVFSDDKEEFAEGIKGVKDPAQRDALLKVRREFNSAMGKTDPLTALLEELQGKAGDVSREGAKGAKAKVEKKDAGALPPKFKFVPGQGLVPVQR